MTGCCAPNCSNRANKGYKVHQFPANKDRRLQWLQNIKRDNWSPTKNSRLCDAHFEEHQFELRRMDGKIKLKPNAIPTIFNHCNKVPKKPRFKALKKKEDNMTVNSFNESLRTDNLQNKEGNSLEKAICKAKNCTSYKSSQPVPLFPFPQSEVRCQVWVQRTQNDQLYGVLATELCLAACLCAQHFDESQFTDEMKKTLVPDALPTIFPRHFVSLPMLEESGHFAPNLSPHEQSRDIEFVKNEPLWDSSDGSTTSKRTPNSEHKLTYQDLFSNASLVKLPSTLWGIHKGQKNEFVAFARMTIPEPNILIDKAIVFKNTCRANVYFNGRRVLLGMSDVKTLLEIESLLYQLNNLTKPWSSSPTSSEET